MQFNEDILTCILKRLLKIVLVRLYYVEKGEHSITDFIKIDRENLFNLHLRLN